MGGTGRGPQVTLAAATDSQDAYIPEPERKVEGPTVNRQRDRLTGTAATPKRQYSYRRGETSEGENP
jgi:hypothetical protein